MAHRTLPCMQAHALQESSFQVSPSCLGQKRTFKLDCIGANNDLSPFSFFLSKRSMLDLQNGFAEIQYSPHKFCRRTCKMPDFLRLKDTEDNNDSATLSDARWCIPIPDMFPLCTISRSWYKCNAYIRRRRIENQNYERLYPTCKHLWEVTGTFHCLSIIIDQLNRDNVKLSKDDYVYTIDPLLPTFAMRTTISGFMNDSRSWTMKNGTGLFGAS